MRAASAPSTGLPRMRAPIATVVSAQRIGAGASPRARRRRARGAQLGARHALDVGLGRLAGARRLERFDVLVGVGEQQLVANADLVEQLAPARALRREVDEAGTARRARRRSFAVIRVMRVDRPGAVDRLGDERADERMRQGQVREAQRLVAARLERGIEAVGPAGDERGVAALALPRDAGAPRAATDVTRSPCSSSAIRRAPRGSAASIRVASAAISWAAVLPPRVSALTVFSSRRSSGGIRLA